VEDDPCGDSWYIRGGNFEKNPHPVKCGSSIPRVQKKVTSPRKSERNHAQWTRLKTGWGGSQLGGELEGFSRGFSKRISLRYK